jgi:serine/threonine protein kinase
MSPEQSRGQEAGPPSDVFSFGCVLYEMVTGRRAFARSTERETMTAILQDDPLPLTDTGQSIPSGLKQLISRCLEKQPENRHPSGHELAVDLRAALDDIRGPNKRRRVVASIGILLLLVAIAGLLWWRASVPDRCVARAAIVSVAGQRRFSGPFA